jgi:hypothetical protein
MSASDQKPDLIQKSGAHVTELVERFSKGLHKL